MLEDIPRLVDDNDDRHGSRTSRTTAKKPWLLGVALLTLFGAAVLPERSLVLPQDKTPLYESMYAEGRQLYAAVHGLARPATGSSTGQDIARPTISVLLWAAAPCTSGKTPPLPCSARSDAPRLAPHHRRRPRLRSGGGMRVAVP